MEKYPLTSGTGSDLRTRERLLAAALDAFATHGFEGASARLIERMASVERGLVAYHFGTKDALWCQAVDALWANYVDQVVVLIRHLRDVSPMERGKAVFKEYARFNAAHPQFFRILMAEGYRRTARSDHLARHLIVGIDLWRTALEFSAEDHPEINESQAIQIFQVVGAAGSAFAMAAYAEPVFGIDFTTPAFIEHFAAVLAGRHWA